MRRFVSPILPPGSEEFRFGLAGNPVCVDFPAGLELDGGGLYANDPDGLCGPQKQGRTGSIL